jgi:hypothetical protein
MRRRLDADPREGRLDDGQPSTGSAAACRGIDDQVGDWHAS